MSREPKCVLDVNDCVNLKSVIATFNTPLNEEHAWAILFQSAKTCSSLGNTRQQLFLTTELYHILLHKDGAVHPVTFTSQRVKEPRRNAAAVARTPAPSEAELVSFLGQKVYDALDYGFLDSEERNLTHELGGLIELMVVADESVERQETDDEGIERDSGESEDEHSDPSCSLLHVMQTCAQQLQLSTSAADCHYRAVCRALVTEALDLSVFLEQVHLKAETSDENDGRSPCPQEWAKSWLFVMDQLRTGVALRHVDVPDKAPISEMTPYEVLMEDIRLKRFTLNRVESPPSAKKDAHAAILDFIRSRPPLKKASERHLKEKPEKVSSVVEQLMESIRAHDLKLLRKSSVEPSSFQKSPLKKLEFDPSIFEDAEDTDDSDTESCDGDRLSSPEMRKYSLSPLPQRPSTYTENWRSASCQEMRRHSVAGPSKLSDYRHRDSPRLRSPMFDQRSARLTLNLDEVVHIRSTLMKAEAERMRADSKVKEILLKGKICACCIRIRFSLLLGPWAQQCRLCQRYVCAKCSFKANIPNTIFKELPQWNLIPSATSVPSVPSYEPASMTPTFHSGRDDSCYLTVDRNLSGPFSFGGTSDGEPSRLSRSFTLSRADTLQMRVVCKDCKGLLYDLIAAANSP